MTVANYTRELKLSVGAEWLLDTDKRVIDIAIEFGFSSEISFSRAFKQQFTLSEDVVVQGAELINGLLTVNLEKIIPDEKKPRIIEIKSPKRISSK